MISFVVPAYNEEAFIADTLNAIHCSARAVNEQYEIIVADDASTDRTAEIARSLGARVERVNYRQIAGTRNAGVRASVGEFIFFVDADTLINPRTLRSALISMKKGAVGKLVQAYRSLTCLRLARFCRARGYCEICRVRQRSFPLLHSCRFRCDRRLSRKDVLGRRYSVCTCVEA